MGKTAICTAAMAIISMTAAADTRQRVTAGGETVDKTVAAITFDGDNVTLAFDDSTCMTADMGGVSIALDYGSGGTAVASPTASPTACSPAVNLKGQRAASRGAQRPKGIYITGGKKRIAR